MKDGKRKFINKFQKWTSIYMFNLIILILYFLTIFIITIVFNTINWIKWSTVLFFIIPGWCLCIILVYLTWKFYQQIAILYYDVPDKIKPLFNKFLIKIKKYIFINYKLKKKIIQEIINYKNEENENTQML